MTESPERSLQALLSGSHQPIVIVGFSGWTDAANSATRALRYVEDQLRTQVRHQFDSDDFYDYQVNRPERRIQPSGGARMVWPQAVLSSATLHGRSAGTVDHQPRELYTLSAPEPSFSWRRFCHLIVQKLQEIQPAVVICLGAMIGQTPHTRPLPTNLTAPTSELASILDIPTSTYQGEVGVTSVFAEACGIAGLTTVTLWTTVPNYLADDFNPGVLALLARVERCTGIALPLTDLRTQVAHAAYEYDRTSAEDDDIHAYVRELEQRYDQNFPAGDQLADEFLHFLREQEPDH